MWRHLWNLPRVYNIITSLCLFVSVSIFDIAFLYRYKKNESIPRHILEVATIQLFYFDVLLLGSA